MAQNIYDDDRFLAGYGAFPRSREGLAATSEWPAFRAMLPDVTGLTVIELGCGFGHLARWLAEHSAARVLAFDLSEKMLARAREDGHTAIIDYQRADLDEIVLEPGTADLIVSSMTLHYLGDFDRIVGQMAGALVPGGRLVFSVEHPIYAARSTPEWVRSDDGRMAFAIFDYGIEGKRVTNWIVDGVVKYHRSIATMVNALIGAGLSVLALDEWRPSPAELDLHPEWRDTELTRPMFLIMSFEKPLGGVI